MPRTFRTLLTIALFAATPALAKLQLPSLFTDGMVLQRDMKAPVWGLADPNVQVEIHFAGQTQSTSADADGHWRVDLDPLTLNPAGQAMQVSAGAEKITIADVRVGEVWLASGQSNMQWAIKASRPEDQQLAASGPIPQLRIFNVPRKLSATNEFDVEAKWQDATPQTVIDFSAVAYFFGRELVDHLDVPIGVIASSWGGSRIEPWTPEAGFAAVPELSELHKSRLPRLPGTPAFRAANEKHLEATRKWMAKADEALKQDVAPPLPPAAPPRLRIAHNGEMGTYQAMIHPLQPFAVRGFIWYQGESNRNDGMAYRWKMEALIEGWRQCFERPDAPFLYAQLAPFSYGQDPKDTLPKIWVAQTKALEIPHTGMAIINDIGDLKDIHPRNKSEVGRRLSLLARAHTYGESELVSSGPLFADFKRTDSTIRIRFQHVGDGLKTRDDKAPDWFEIAGIDGQFHAAEASLEGKDLVALTSPAVERPTQARFAWSKLASPNLVNSANLPASAFHTHWPDDPDLGPNVAAGKPHKSSDPNRSNWDSGLTDGTWDGQAGRCYATGLGNFPKHVTVDLGESHEINRVRIGTPAFGSTRTVSISLSRDGKTFTEVGRHAFPAKAESRELLTFDPQAARHVRVGFIDAHPKQDQFDPKFGFLRELEVYAKQP
ncbi:sialate O-acetylesterase [Haloferula rosea]|uniref:Discoidin domain-containing protein n=1 Tax=Haloferula rosea TaxID=490093 RepID=A0A934RCP8_9BACT|nr:sialate O-acetylesterase [Haloferula rosea]MBK1827172.1 discoidin domain-containing protein [Haloferula rosea]